MVDGFYIIGVSIRSSNENGQSVEDMGQLWGRFYAEGISNQIPEKESDAIYSVFMDYDSDYRGKYTALIGHKVSSLDTIPEGMVGKKIVGGTYQKVISKGKMPDAIVESWKNIWEKDAELKRKFKKSDEYASYMRIVEASKKIEPPKFDVDQAWNTFKATQMGQVPKVVPLRPFKQFLRIAAVVAVMMVGSYFYLNSLNETFTTDLAERTEVTLPDTSKVILNADSEITFSEKKWDENRRITLKGEAFFKVAKGEKFTVATENGVVTVLGTQFNIENRNGFFEVSCYEGLVRVSYKGSEQKLHAGSSMVAINGKIMNDKGLTALQPAWMNNESSFKSIPLKYVLAEFERQYDVEVKTKNIDTEQLFTGTFSNTDINLALKSISTPSQIRFTLEDDNVLFYAEKTP